MSNPPPASDARHWSWGVGEELCWLPGSLGEVLEMFPLSYSEHSLHEGLICGSSLSCTSLSSLWISILHLFISLPNCRLCVIKGCGSKHSSCTKSIIWVKENKTNQVGGVKQTRGQAKRQARAPFCSLWMLCSLFSTEIPVLLHFRWARRRRMGEEECAAFLRGGSSKGSWECLLLSIRLRTIWRRKSCNVQ